MNSNALRTLAASAAFAASLFAFAFGVLADTTTIAYWPFGENGFADVSGNGHDLTPNGTLAASDAAYVTLNGTGDYLTTASALDLSGESAVTFECWTRSTGTHGTVDALFSSANPGSTAAGSLVLYYTGRLQAQFGMGTEWHIDYTASTSAMDDGMWHHVAYVIDRAKTGAAIASLYLDGVRMADAGSPDGSAPSFLNETFFIGGGSLYCENANFFTGSIDDVRISRGALTPGQFLKYPSVGKAMRADSDALPVVAYWPFGGMGGRDATGNGFDLVMGAVPLVSGNPDVEWATQGWSGDFKCVGLPFSAFSKTGVTIEFFAKTASTFGYAGNILTLSPNDSYYNNAGAFRFGPNAGFQTMAVSFRCKDSGTYMSSTTTTDRFGAINDGRWRHYAAVYDPSKTGPGILSLYVDGVVASNSTTVSNQGAIALADTTLHFQRININGSTSAPFFGPFDDVRITVGALSPDQFLTARSAGSTVALYRFDRETLEDQTGNGNDLVNVGDAIFGDGSTVSGLGTGGGTGIVLNGTSQYLKSAGVIDLSGTKAATVEMDFTTINPGNNNFQFLMGSANPGSTAAGIVFYRNGQSLVQAQLKHPNPATAGWTYAINASLASSGREFHSFRHAVNASTASVKYSHIVDGGTATAGTASDTFSGLVSSEFRFGHDDYYINSVFSAAKFLRVAISDVELAAADYVLDNLIDPETKRTLAYWNFSNSSDSSGHGNNLTESGTSRRNGAAVFDGSASAATEDTLALSGLTQATIECFVLFGETPSSGTIFSMGSSGAGSFAVAADAEAGTLSGSFAPYTNSLGNTVSCGGAAALAPLAGRKVWHHVALVIDRTSPGADAVRLYVDYERATPAGRAWDAAARMLDGTLSVGTGFTGRIDDLRVSAGALDTTEFLQPGERTETPDAFMIIVR